MTAGKKIVVSKNVTLNCRNFRYNDHNDLHWRYIVIGPFFAPSSQDIIRIALFHTHMVLVLVKHLSKSPGSQVIHQIPMVSS